MEEFVKTFRLEKFINFVNFPTINEYKKYKYLFDLKDRSVSTNPQRIQKFTWKDIQENKDICWSYNNLSKNSFITWEIVKDNPDKPWNFAALSLNPNITLEIVKNNPDFPWNYEQLNKNPNITWASNCSLIYL